MTIDRRRLLSGSLGATLVAATAVTACHAKPAETASAHLNLAILGHEGHGKTTLSRAIRRHQASKGLGAGDGDASEDLSPVYTEFRTDQRSYALIDNSGAVSAIPATIAGLASADAAILVVSAADGPMPQTREHILLARQMAAESMVVFLSKADLNDDPELIELITLETRELLNAYQLPGDEIPVVVGSAQAALSGRKPDIGERRMEAMLDALDRMPAPFRRSSGPFRMPVEDVFNISGRGLVVTGRVERGQARVGQALALVGHQGVLPVECQGIEMFRRLLDSAAEGDFVGVLLKGVTRDMVQPGDVLAAPGSADASRNVRGEAYVLSTPEGGLTEPAPAAWPVQLYFSDGMRANATLSAAKGSEALEPGAVATIEIVLDTPMALERGIRFVVREEDRTVGVGVVSETA